MLGPNWWIPKFFFDRIGSKYFQVQKDFCQKNCVKKWRSKIIREKIWEYKQLQDPKILWVKQDLQSRVENLSGPKNVEFWNKLSVTNLKEKTTSKNFQANKILGPKTF